MEDKYIYLEYESGMKTDRAELQKLLDIVTEGDTIATTEVSRLTRSTKHLCEILQTVQDKKIILNIGNSFVVDCSKGEMNPMVCVFNDVFNDVFNGVFNDVFNGVFNDVFNVIFFEAESNFFVLIFSV